ncbi:MAG: GNAT family N-acetyltransferase [Armatimonas sp.]
MNFLSLSTETEYDRYADTYNAFMPPPPQTGAEIKSRDARKIRPRGRFLIEKDGKDVGVAGFSQSEFCAEQDRCLIWAYVRPEYLGQGIATFAQEKLFDQVTALGMNILEAGCRETNQAGLEFLESQGFAETMREWESILNVANFDPALFAGAREHVETAGLRLTTLAEEISRLGQREAYLRLHSLDEEVGPDVPSDAPEITPPFEEWEKTLLSGPNFRPDSFFLAVAPDDSYAGISMLFHKQATKDLTTGLTGVRRAWRRHGVALALKLMAIDYAKSLGAPQIYTENATTNVGMLSINQKLGFVRQPAEILFKRTLA